MLDYWSWLERQERRRPRRPRPTPVLEVEHHVRPSEPLEVIEHTASTTIVRKIRAAILGRIRGD